MFSRSANDTPRALNAQDGNPERLLIREADLDLAARLGYGVYGYFMIFGFLWVTTRYPEEHSSLFWIVFAGVTAAMSLRIILTVFREPIYDFSARALKWPLVFSVVLGSGCSGVLFASALWFYGFEDWTFIVTLLWMTGIVAGSGVSFSPNRKIMWLHNVLLLGPVLLRSIYGGGTKGRTFAILCTGFILFMIAVGNHLNNIYWEALKDRALESARARELEAAKQSAEAANLAKSQFLAHTSHEIRTPMHGILGMARLAIDAETPQESREHLLTLCSCTQGLLNVLNDILDFSKIEAGKLTLEKIPFSLRQLVHEVHVIILPLARAKGLVLQRRIAEEIPDMLLGDPTRLRQVFMNLMGNAVKFTQTGSVALCAAGVSSIADQCIRVRFEVSDTGIGIAPAHQAKIFEAYTQADGSVSRRFGGTGLGLSISFQLVHLMGGRLSVESKQNAGSTFYFSCAFEVAGKVPAAAAAPAERMRPIRILLAEDNPVNQVLASTLLRKRGHQIKVVQTGLAAVRACETEEFDLILMDDQMPGMSGMEAAREIRARESFIGKRTYIIALTANDDLADRAQLEEAGLDSYLAKPYTAEELYAAIARVGAASKHATVQ
jgi:signal transduction histidine kinase/CheY-like chemotaxis protein